MKLTITALVFILTLNFAFGQAADTAKATTPIRIICYAPSTQNQEPLIIVDGKIVESLNKINLDDIVNVTVLKDANATAIYGIRGATGVVLLTSKSHVKLHQDKMGSLSKKYREYIAKNPGKNKVNYVLNGKALTDTTLTIPEAILAYSPDSVKTVKFVSSKDKPTVKITTTR